MSLPINSALYYPTIEFRDFRWLWTAALVWDKIYRIQPNDFAPNEPENVRELCEGGDIGIPLLPKEYAANVAFEFLSNLESGKWSAAALDRDRLREYTRIHHDKIDVQIREMLIASGSAASHDKWLYVPRDFEALYMTYLAKKMAEKNNLQPISDTNAAWAALTYYSNRTLDTEREQNQLPFALIALMIGNFVPANITDISPKALLDFRNRYPDERRNFMRAMKDAGHQLSNCNDAKVVRELVHSIEADVSRAVADFKRSMVSLKVDSFVGSKLFSFSMSTSAFSGLVHRNFNETLILGAAGLAVSLITGAWSLRGKGKKLSKESDYSYLLHAEEEFPRTADAIMIPRLLERDLNEFIND